MVTLAIIRRVGLDINLEKAKAMVYIPGYIWDKWIKAAYKRRDTREGATFSERNQAMVSFSECGVTVMLSLLKGHMKMQYGRSVPNIREADIGRGGGDQLPMWFPSPRC